MTSQHLTAGVGVALSFRGRPDFIHVTLKILSGRTSEQKSHLANTVLDTLVALNYSALSITIAIEDMDRDSYRKIVKE